MVLLGPSSEPVRALSAGRPDVAEQLLAPSREPAGERLRLEAVHLKRDGTGAGSLRLAAHTMGLADQLAIRMVLTNAVRFGTAAGHRHRLGHHGPACRIRVGPGLARTRP